MQTLTRRVYLLLVILLIFTIPASANAPASTVDMAAQSLINRHANLLGGWAWQSVIQSPHYQLDRDVGAASIGVGFLAGYDATLDAKLKVKYLNAAEQVANFLVEAQTPANSGRWPDYYDPAGPASYGYTSLDDGAAGISDFLWLLYERDNYSVYRDAALTGMNWLVSMAQAPLGANCPEQQCYWRWRDPYNNSTPIYTGIGSGMAGIVYTLDKFAERTDDKRISHIYQKYALAGAAYLEAQINVDGSVSEKVGGRSEFDTGLYAGAAGDAFVFYSLYLHTHDARWLNDANKIMAWVRLQGVAQTSGTAWPVSVGAGNIGNRTLSTEVAEGAAGIGWAELQAYKVTQSPIDLATAQEAGDWLLSIAVKENNGYTWPAYAGQTDYYTALDLGVGGISVFLHDLSIATGNAKYELAAQKAQIWLSSVQFQDSLGTYWYQDRNNGTWTNPKEPSWNWGLAGILGSAASLNGWTIDMPRDVPGF